MIRLGPIADTALVARLLAPHRLIACASASYFAERGTPTHPAGLAGYEYLGFAYWSGALARRWQFTRDDRSFEAEVDGRLEINDGSAILHTALNGFGILLGAEPVVREEIAAGRLVRVLPDYDGPSRPMHLIFAADRCLTPKLRRLINAVMAEFSGQDSQERSIIAR